jgi:methyl-accepting chemotaxis protein
MKYSDLKIGARLAIAFCVVLCLLCVVAIVGWQSLSANNRQAEVIVEENNVKIAAANAMRGFLNTEVRSLRNIILYTDAETRRAQKDVVLKARKQYDDTFARLQSLLKSDAARKLSAEIESDRAKIRPSFDKVISLAEASNEKEAASYLQTSVQTPQSQWFSDIQAMIELQEKQNQQSITTMRADYAVTLEILLALTLAAVALGAFSAWYATRSITAPLGDAVSLAQRVAAGDLTAEIRAASRDETGMLITALRTMNDNLAGIVREVRSGTDTVATASSQIATGNLELSSRTEQQASSLEETASAMEQMTATVKHNAENAREANQLVANTSNVAKQGGVVMEQVIEKMEAITLSSKKIVDIISVIDSIAFQTNILSLNAAVEAARAGEQGRGFAVVATEVRNLAARSASAAKEIKVLIEDSVAQVDEGSRLVTHAGSTIGEVVNSVKSVADIMSEITIASSEQSSGISEINSAITQMEAVTQQNAALVQEASAASQALQEQADRLAQSMSVFKTAAV